MFSVDTIEAFEQTTFEEARVNEAVTGIRGTTLAVRHKHQLHSAKLRAVNGHARIYLHACNAQRVALPIKVTLFLSGIVALFILLIMITFHNYAFAVHYFS